MHNYEYRTGTNLYSLINYFENFEYIDEMTDRPVSPTSVDLMSGSYKSISEAKDAAGDRSYWSATSIAITKVVEKKLTKAFENAYKNFVEKRKEYIAFKRDLTIAYGRKSTKVTCPHCGSSISLNYGRRYKECPVCGSKKIISDSNWKALETKKNLMHKASITLQGEAEHCGVTFVGAIGYHS